MEASCRNSLISEKQLEIQQYEKKIEDAKNTIDREKAHNGEKTHHCDVCNKQFSVKGIEMGPGHHTTRSQGIEMGSWELQQFVHQININYLGSLIKICSL